MESEQNDGRGAVIDALAEFPETLARVVAVTPDHLTRRRGSDDFFAVVEHVWHLADLEEEGFGQRIDRILGETNPELPDFRGDEIALQRRYLEQPIAPALERFARIRAANRQRLLGVTGEQWSRRGVQELVGAVTLGDIPRLMLEHDREHARQLVALLGDLGVAVPEELVVYTAPRV